MELTRWRCGVVLWIMLLLGSASAFAGELQEGYSQAVFGFVGRVTASDDSPFTTHYEENFVVGAGYQTYAWEFPRNLLLGFEVGGAGRFGESSSAEFWGGAVVRYDGFMLFDMLRLAPAFTFGLSGITGTLEGRESENAIRDGGDPTLLFYLGPEVSLSLPSRPDIELFTRVHHRSGAWGTLGDMHGAANASSVGVRLRF